MNDLTIQRGNPYSATITITDATGAAYNLTGKTVFFTIKHLNDEAADDAAAVIKKDITSHVNAAGGITALALSAADTLQIAGRYKCDIRVYSSGGVQLNSERFYANIVNIVTKRIA